MRKDGCDVDTGGTVKQRKVTCTGVDAPWPADKHGEKMGFSAESFHCSGQTVVTLDTVKRCLHTCAKLVKMLLN